MRVSRGYETTLIDRDERRVASIALVPTEARKGRAEELLFKWLRASEVVDLTELTLMREVELADVLAAMFRLGGSPKGDPEGLLRYARYFAERRRAERPDIAEIAQFPVYVTTAPVVPYEASPLGSESLESIAERASSAAPGVTGTGIALAAVGPSPLLLIAAPACIVLVKVALELGDGLGEWVREQVRRWTGEGRGFDGERDSAP